MPEEETRGVDYVKTVKFKLLHYKFYHGLHSFEPINPRLGLIKMNCLPKGTGVLSSEKSELFALLLKKAYRPSTNAEDRPENRIRPLPALLCSTKVVVSGSAGAKQLFLQLAASAPPERVSGYVTERWGGRQDSPIVKIERANRGNVGRLLEKFDQLSNEEVNSLLSDLLAGKEIRG